MSRLLTRGRDPHRGSPTPLQHHLKDRKQGRFTGSAWLSSLIKLAEEEGGPHERFLEVSREIPHTVRRTSPGEVEGDVRSSSPGEVEGALRLGRVWPERRPVSSGCQAEHPGFPQRESWGLSSWGPSQCGPRNSQPCFLRRWKSWVWSSGSDREG